MKLSDASPKKTLIKLETKTRLQESFRYAGVKSEIRNPKSEIRKIICLALFLCVLYTAAAAEPAAAGGGIFPLVPLLDTAISGEVRWLPDWTVDMPPDAFSPTGPRCRAVTVRYPDGELRLSRRRDGRLGEFPCRINGALYQAAAAWDARGRLASIQAAFNLTAAGTTAVDAAGDGGTAAADGVPANGGTAAAGGAPANGGTANNGAEDEAGADTLFIEALAYTESGYPTMLRLANGASYFFVSIDAREGKIIETWFAYTEGSGVDGDGTAAEKPDGGATANGETGGGESAAVVAAVFCHKIDGQTGAAYQILSLYPVEASIETRSFDSFGNITSLTSSLGEFTALYNEKGLRYWGHFAIQRDETGVPIRLSAIDGGEQDERRYEYRFDRQGNWTERREIRMRRTGGVLLPEAGPAVSRTINYF
ncbi:MAG: hypothetical protein LBD20_09875 [Spirochaetaceae bacterium]|jgi:hypothetical protein|nr:hypothetical protein [Spirochaetaceae bacterium]